MNWDAIGAVGEIVGAFAVVMSLLYVSKQMRASNRATANSTNQQIFQSVKTVFAQITASNESAEIYMKGLSDDPSLTSTELFRFQLMLAESVMDWEMSHHSNVSNEIDPWLVEIGSGYQNYTINTPGFKRWYKSNRNTVSSEFKKVLDTQLSNSANGT
ncbi:MAG: hypothetical protein ACJAY7_000483 [Pseudohongiellaceae bacterium]|jgi:hypothetical protein